MTRPIDVAGFSAIVMAAAYVQTLTGFAFGVLVMAAVALTATLPLDDAAVVVSVLVIVNATQILVRGWRNVNGRDLALILIGSLPMLLAGFFTLEWLATARLDLVRVLLGLVIGLSAVQHLRRGAPRTLRSSDATFLAFGALAGFVGGMFSTAGPPLVFHMYRQPFPVARIRETLVAVFAVNAAVRLAMAGMAGTFTGPLATIGLLAAVPVMGATFAAERFAPPLSRRATSYLVSALLLLSGLALAGPPCLRMIGVRPI